MPAGASRYQRRSRVTGIAWGLVSPIPLAPVQGRAQGRHRRLMRGLDLRAGAQGRQSARPLTWHGLIRFSSDRVHKALVESLACGFTFIPDERAVPSELGHGLSFEAASGKDRLGGRLGFRVPLTDRERQLLDEYRSQLTKLQFALWARAFAETDAEPERPVVVTLSQLCDDLGYRRLQNGAHRPELKRQVAALLALLTAVEVDAEYRAPDGRTARLRGPLWQRFPDLEPERSLAYAPGAWAADPLWSRFNRRVALAGAGLLALRPDRDRWAISVGGYLATLARMNGYRPLTVRVETLLERTGLGEAEQRNPSRMREMLERALEQLEAVGVIAGWDWFSSDHSEPDMDAPSDLARLAGTAPHWAQRSLVIQWPAPLRDREASLRSRREASSRTKRVRTTPAR